MNRFYPCPSLLSITSILLLFINSVPSVLCSDSCRNLSLAFERCEQDADCFQPYGWNSFSYVICDGRDSTDKLVLCPHPDVRFCLCDPDSVYTCRQNSDCRDEEYCGVDRRTGNRLCVGCKQLTYTRPNFRPVQPFASQQRCAGPRPVCGQTMDFCSTTLPCSGGLSCVVEALGKVLTCHRSNIACRCFDMGEMNRHITLKSCTSNSDCSRSRENCAWDISTSENYCVSCDAVRETPHLVLNDTSKCDALTETRPMPRFYRSPSNGLTFDLCQTDKHCIGTHTCKRYSNIKQPQRGLVDCDDVESLCFCAPQNNSFQSCTTGEDCIWGESCVSSSAIQMSNKCASNALGEVTGADKFQFVGNRTYSGKGNGLTGDSCYADWDCKMPRRCTHVSDTFGGCAGRKGCRCMPLGTPECTTDVECADGERCAKHVDSYKKPSCMSGLVVKENSFLVPVNNHHGAVQPTPLPQGVSRGLTEDPCLSDDDCLGQRKCLHSTEYAGQSCNRARRSCVCRFMVEGRMLNGTRPKACEDSKDCPLGEICTVIEDAVPEEPVCMSTLTFDKQKQAQSEPPRVELGVRQTPFPTPSLSASPVEPIEQLESTVTPQPEVEDEETETATEVPVATESESSPIVSEDQADVCVDAELLRGMERRNMVFREHRRAAVLCDKDGSCATLGHMVVLHGRPMTMGTYCKGFVKGGCYRRVKLVNSPRMTVKLRIVSRTQGLSMTAMAARYCYRMEEILLQVLIRLGL